MNRITLASVLSTAALSLAFVQPAAAVTQSRLMIQPGAHMCTLSLPTTDTKVRPRANGFRNEGTTSAFTICSFDPTSGGGISTNFTSASVILKSLDGADHSVTCTAVNSLPNSDAPGVGGAPQQFVSKTLTVNDSGPLTVFGTQFAWTPADFGGTTDMPFTGGALSVTCNLPPQVSVITGIASSAEDIGT